MKLVYGAAMQLIKLTSSNGTSKRPVWINPEMVVSVAEALRVPGTTLQFQGGSSVNVIGDVEDIAELLIDQVVIDAADDEQLGHLRDALGASSA